MRREERIDNGIRLLDEKYGPDWVELIDLNELDLSSTCNCVVGQVYHRGLKRRSIYWSTKLRAFGIPSSDEAPYYGFNVRPGNERWETLTESWKRVIRRLRKARSATPAAERAESVEA